MVSFKKKLVLLSLVSVLGLTQVNPLLYAKNPVEIPSTKISEETAKLLKSTDPKIAAAIIVALLVGWGVWSFCNKKADIILTRYKNFSWDELNAQETVIEKIQYLLRYAKYFIQDAVVGTPAQKSLVVIDPKNGVAYSTPSYPGHGFGAFIQSLKSPLTATTQSLALMLACFGLLLSIKNAVHNPNHLAVEISKAEVLEKAIASVISKMVTG